jgi:drug/metabolite transporter (DMT)-like permease
VAIGALFLDEPVTLWLLLGGALVVGGVAVAQRRPARKAGIPPKACIERADGQRCRT